jgi:hypothetical protein
MRFGFFQLGDMIDCAQYYNDRQVDNSWPSVGLKEQRKTAQLVKAHYASLQERGIDEKRHIHTGNREIFHRK